MSPNRPMQPRDELRKQRLLRNWTQKFVAEQIGTTDLNIIRWERGRTLPNPGFRRELCRLFNMSAEELGIAEGPPVFSHVIDYEMPFLEQPFVGREVLLSNLIRLLREPHTRRVALVGIPGIGKTALAVTIAHHADREDYYDGVLWAALGPTPKLLAILKRWSDLFVLKSQLSSTAEYIQALRRAIGIRHLLLVVDDVWNEEDFFCLKDVAGPNCTLLLTTRSPRIAYRHAVSVLRVEELDESEAVILLRQNAAQVYQMVTESETHRLIQAAAGLPLALITYGSSLRQHAYKQSRAHIQQILQELSEPIGRLYTSEPAQGTGLHPCLASDQSVSVAAIMKPSDDQLNDEARLALRALAILSPKPTMFSEEAALAITNTARTVIDSLCDSGLLETRGEGYYTLHPLITEYAYLEKKGMDLAGAVQRLIAYSVDYIRNNAHDDEALKRESSTLLTALDAAYTIGDSGFLSYLRGVSDILPFLRRFDKTLAQRHLFQAQQSAHNRGTAFQLPERT